MTQDQDREVIEFLALQAFLMAYEKGDSRVMEEVRLALATNDLTALRGAFTAVVDHSLRYLAMAESAKFGRVRFVFHDDVEGDDMTVDESEFGQVLALGAASVGDEVM